jgi:hypothetical protein
VKCKKHCYRDCDEAKRALHRIKGDSDRPNKGYKPVRWYECEVCGFIHLTSQSLDNTVGYRVENINLEGIELCGISK